MMRGENIQARPPQSGNIADEAGASLAPTAYGLVEDPRVLTGAQLAVLDRRDAEMDAKAMRNATGSEGEFIERLKAKWL